MARIIGVCVFQSVGDGCLLSKYVNNMTDPYPESCKIIGSIDTTDPYIGLFRTAWIERLDNNTVNSRTGELTIERGGPFNNYKLSWRPNSGEQYDGEGMIFNGNLIACFWSLPRNP